MNNLNWVESDSGYENKYLRYKSHQIDHQKTLCLESSRSVLRMQLTF